MALAVVSHAFLLVKGNSVGTEDRFQPKAAVQAVSDIAAVVVRE